jgi:hypothetical protein
MGDIPNASFTYSGNNNTINFSNTSFNSTTFNWDFGDGNVSNLTNPQHQYTNPGVYIVSLSASTNCNTSVKTDTLTILPTTILEKNSANFNLYPNPTDGSVVIQFEKLEKNALVQLYNYIGQKVFEEKFISINTIELNLRNYPSGIYNLVVQENNGQMNTTSLIKK